MSKVSLSSVRTLYFSGSGDMRENSDKCWHC